MDDQTSLLLQRVAVLRSQLKSDKSLPRTETVESLVAELEQAIEYVYGENDLLRKEKEMLTRQAQDLVRKNDLLRRQNETLEHHGETLERERKTLERHNTNLLRQKSQVEHHNAALEESRASLETEKRRYSDLFEFAPDAYLITDNTGIIQDANRAAAEMLRTSQRELKAESLLSFIAVRHQPLFMTLLTRLQRMKDIELSILPHGLARSSEGVDTSLTLSTFYDETGKPVLLLWLLRDMTERRRAMAALNASERRFRTVFNEASLGIVLLDLEGKIVRANRALQEMLGYSEQELYNRELAGLACPDDAPLGNVALMLKDNRQGHFFIENRLQRRDGQYIWSGISLSALSNEHGQVQYAMAMIENITAEKQAAAELAEMRRRLLENGETERLRLAQELHDGPTQDLYAAAFRLSNISDQMSDSAQQDEMQAMQEMLKQVANILRDIVGELRPPTIANLGLERAIRSHVDRLQEQHPNLELKLHLTRDGQTLPPHTRLAFFRIYQQCMSNILRHAQASQVVIAFHVNENEATLDIWDNGKGFTLPTKWVDLLREGHYGLAGIAERVEALGGALKVETKPGAGTLVHVSAPCEKII
jgi:PAS domain S-box-containing protein